MEGVQMEPSGKIVHTLEGKSMSIVEFGGIEVYSTNSILGFNRNFIYLFKHPIS